MCLKWHAVLNIVMNNAIVVLRNVRQGVSYMNYKINRCQMFEVNIY